MSVLDKINDFIGKEAKPLNEDIHADISKLKKALMNKIKIQYSVSEEEIDELFYDTLPNADTDDAWDAASRFKEAMRVEMLDAFQKFINKYKFD